METIATTHSSWFKHWFDSAFYHKLYAHRDEKEAADFIDALLLELQPAKDARMMDLGCGAGRHAKYLASKGFDTTGIDLAFSSIRTARQSATDKLRFFQRDMRKPFGDNTFDYVFNFFTSFGYFKSDEDNKKVIGNISRALKPGGRLVLDYLNVHYAQAGLIPREEKEIDGIIYHIIRWDDGRHFFKKIAIDNMPGEAPFEYTEQVEKLYLHDFMRLFQCNGVDLQSVYGDYRLNPYNVIDSPRLIMTVVKK